MIIPEWLELLSMKSSCILVFTIMPPLYFSSINQPWLLRYLYWFRFRWARCFAVAILFAADMFCRCHPPHSINIHHCIFPAYVAYIVFRHIINQFLKRVRRVSPLLQSFHKSWCFSMLICLEIWHCIMLYFNAFLTFISGIIVLLIFIWFYLSITELYLCIILYVYKMIDLFSANINCIFQNYTKIQIVFSMV